MPEIAPTERPLGAITGIRLPNHAEEALHRLYMLDVTAREALEAYNRWVISPLGGTRREELQDAMDKLGAALYGKTSSWVYVDPGS